ncbi:MAG: N-acetylmuramoyl-L-alanine amidase [Chloroflexi bacterium]|nr:N-acetylmuramoyl-L-alanine amidase [Chloroflexota bacterium]
MSFLTRMRTELGLLVLAGLVLLELSMGGQLSLAQGWGRRVGIQAGHWQTEVGATCPDGTREVDVTVAVANKAAHILRGRGYKVDVFPAPARYTHNYSAAAFVALHADQCDALSYGYKVSRWHGTRGSGTNGSGDATDQWVNALWSAYGAATGLAKDTEPGHFTPCMVEYYALNPTEGGRICTGHPKADQENWTQVHGVSAKTPGAIIEMGWLSGDYAFITSDAGQDKMALGIANAVDEFLNKTVPPPPDQPPSDNLLEKLRRDIEQKIAEESAKLEKRVEEKINEEADRLEKRIEEMIQQEVERQLNQLCGAPALLWIGIAIIVVGRSKAGK